VNILVVGAGAIGGPVAGRLTAEGDDVRALDAWRDHVEAINSDGLRTSGARGDGRFAVKAVYWQPEAHAAELLPGFTPDVAFVCTKSMVTENAALLIREIAASDSAVVSLQNGVNEDRLAELLAPRVLGAVTEIGGYVEGPGHIVETRAEGGFVVGELDGAVTERARMIADLLSRCAPTSVSENIIGHLWSKLIWNCMMNALCALTGLGQGEVVTSNVTRSVAMAVGREAAAAARAGGIRLEPLGFLGVDLPALVGADPGGRERAERQVIELYSRQMGKGTSMVQDIATGRPTEVDALNGYVVRKASAMGVEAPRNAAITRIVHEVEAGEKRPGPDVTAELVAAVLADLAEENVQPADPTTGRD
jgi:2-dehydropantoate 2-reductase